MADQAARLARTLADVTRRLETLERSPQLAHSTVQVGGTTVRVVDGLAAGLTAEAKAAEAVRLASSAEAKADGAVQVFYGVNEPQGASLGDFWVDNDGNAYTWNGSVFVPVTSTEVRDALVAAQNAEAALDGKVTTFFSATAPTAEAVGDVWFDSNNRMRRWSGSAWIDVQDKAIPAAQKTADDAATAAGNAASAASTALTAANGKNTVTYSVNTPTSSTPGKAAGDLWFVRGTSASAPIVGVHEWNGNLWISRALGDAVLANITAGKILTGTLAAGTSIIAGNPNGARVELNGGTGLVAYNAAAQLTFRVRSDTGNVEAAGTFRSGFQESGRPFTTLSPGVRSSEGKLLPGIEFNRGDIDYTAQGGWNSAIFNFAYPDQDGGTWLTSWERLRDQTGRSDVRDSPTYWHNGSNFNASLPVSQDMPNGRVAYINSSRHADGLWLRARAGSPPSAFNGFGASEMNLEGTYAQMRFSFSGGTGTQVQTRGDNWNIGHFGHGNNGSSITADANGIISTLVGSNFNASLFPDGDLLLRSRGSSAANWGGRLVGNFYKIPNSPMPAGEGAGALRSGRFAGDAIWFAWNDPWFEIWVNQTRLLSLTANPIGRTI